MLNQVCDLVCPAASCHQVTVLLGTSNLALETFCQWFQSVPARRGCVTCRPGSRHEGERSCCSIPRRAPGATSGKNRIANTFNRVPELTRAAAATVKAVVRRERMVATCDFGLRCCARTTRARRFVRPHEHVPLTGLRRRPAHAPATGRARAIVATGKSLNRPIKSGALPL